MISECILVEVIGRGIGQVSMVHIVLEFVLKCFLILYNLFFQESAVTVEVSALELFVNYAEHVPANSLSESWPSLIHLFKEAPSLSPPAQFLLIGALSQFVKRCSLTDKKDLKELQDITVKVPTFISP